MRTKEELRAEFCKHDDKFEYSILSATISDYSQWLEQKLIDQEPKQREEFEEINIFEDSTYTIQFRDNLTSRGTSDFRIKGSELLKLMLKTK